MIEKFYNTNVAIFRNQWTEESGIHGSELNGITEARGHIQQASVEEIQNTQGNYTLTHSLWLPCGTDIQTGDTLIIDDYYFTVRSIHNHCFVGSNNHLKVAIEKGEYAGES
jgi:hypothetical protein